MPSNSIPDNEFFTVLNNWFIGSLPRIVVEGTYGLIEDWDTSEVTNMSYAFYGRSSFNQSLNSWNMENVTTTKRMFQSAAAFNQDISGWNMENVTTTQSMFEEASSFNQPLNSWNMEQVITTESMFQSAAAFNQDINNWYTPKLNNTDKMFFSASLFNKKINNWYVVNVTSMESMFQDATSFDQSLNLWNMRKVESTKSMFQDATAFNQNISSWILPSLTDATMMFQNAESFIQTLSQWGDLPGVNITDFSLSSLAELGNGNPVWITEINENTGTGTFDVDDIIKVRESIAAVSEGVTFMSGPRYGYISIDDHQTNSKSEFQVVYNDSVRDDNIIARINLAPQSVHTLSLRDAGMASLLNRTRTYQGPVDIQKLTIKLYDEYGRIIDLNNTDWSFTLEFEKEVNRLVENDKS